MDIIAVCVDICAFWSDVGNNHRFGSNSRRKGGKDDRILSLSELILIKADDRQFNENRAFGRECLALRQNDL